MICRGDLAVAIWPGDRMTSSLVLALAGAPMAWGRKVDGRFESSDGRFALQERISQMEGISRTDVKVARHLE